MARQVALSRAWTVYRVGSFRDFLPSLRGSQMVMFLLNLRKRREQRRLMYSGGEAKKEIRARTQFCLFFVHLCRPHGFLSIYPTRGFEGFWEAWLLYCQSLGVGELIHLHRSR